MYRSVLRITLVAFGLTSMILSPFTSSESNTKQPNLDLQNAGRSSVVKPAAALSTDQLAAFNPLVLNSPVVPFSGTPYTGTAISLPGRIETENFDVGGEGVAYHDTTASNDGGFYRSEGVDICTCGSPYGLSVGWTQPGEWMEYTVNVATYGTYKFQTLTATIVSGTAVHIEVDGVNVTGQMTLPNTGAWHVYGATSSTPVTLTAGQHIVRVAVDVTGFLIDSVDVIRLNTPYGGTAPQLPGTIPSENFDNGGEAVAYHDTTPANEGGAYRSEGVDLCFCGNSSGTAIGWSQAGEWTRYTVNFSTADAYTLQARVSSIGSDGLIHLEVDGVNITGQMVVPNTGSWDAWTMISKPNVQISAGQHEIKMVIESGGFLLDSLTALPSVPNAPSGLTANAVSNNQINLAWVDNSFNESGFKVERKTGPSDTYAEITTTAAGVTSFNNTGLQPSTQYFYRVRATNLGGNSAYSNEANATTSNLLPSVSVTAPSAGTVFTAPANITINASASDADGTVSKVEFFQGSTKLGEDLSAPYSFNWTNVAANTYSLTAKATDNLGGVTTSASIAITVNAVPTISITAPAANAVFHSPANLTITASASDSDGTITKVEFFQNGNLLGEDTSSPYSYVWNNAPVGSFSLTARATDNRNATATSSAVAIIVNNPPSVSISAPTSNSTFFVGSTISISAPSSDTDGTVTKVEFYQGLTKLGEDLASPFAFDWTNVQQGSYSLTAVATDNRGALTTSAAVPINVVASAISRLDPRNRTGGGGEDPLSRNFNWSLPLVSLPGRAGMDLGLTLSYNSLVWTKTGSFISFDDDHGFPSAGFRLGFPIIQPLYYNPEVGKNAYLLIGSDGSHIELRQVGTSGLFESADSAHLLLDTTLTLPAPDNGKFVLRTTDGTRMWYELIGGDYQCTRIKDRNGNFITINYLNAKLDTITDTLNRQIKFEYNANGLLEKITQVWKQQTANERTQTWASFAYTDVTFQTAFTGLTVAGPENGSTRKLLSKVTLADNSPTPSNNSRFEFSYTSWGQIRKVTNFAADNRVLNYRSYNLPLSNSPTEAQTDCPRFTERRDWAENWNRSGTPATGYMLPTGPEQEVLTTFAVPNINENDSWTMPDGTPQTGTRTQVTIADGTPEKVTNEIYFIGQKGSQTNGWRRGLPALVRTHDSNGVLQRQVMTTWIQDNEAVAYSLNPRVEETNTYDEPPNNRKRVRIAYATIDLGNGMSCKLPEDIFEYQANASTVLRRTHTTYHPDPDSAYKTRRILGLAIMKSLYEVKPDLSEKLMSKVAFFYDGNAIEGAADPTATQHDNANFGISFVIGRGNLTSVQRYDVDHPDNATIATTTTNRYNRTGSVVSAIDAMGHEVKFIYTDEFATNAGPTDPNPLDAERPFQTLAYPTRVDDADGYSTRIRYNYDFGARTWQQTPQPNVTDNTPGPEQTFTFDAIGRLIRTTSLTNNAFTRYNYGPNYVETFSSINSGIETNNEGHLLTVFDGLGRTIATASDHPNSTGGFSAQLILYDLLGRVRKRSNPTETNISITGSPINAAQFVPLGDDALPNGGWNYVQQTYDWKGRPLVTTNQDGTTKTAEYTGCGCAGGEVVTLTDEGTIDGGVAKRRQQKVYSDVLGRIVKTEVLNWQGGTPYSTTVNTYNARDQLTRITEYAGLEGSSTYQETAMTYDGYGRLLTAHRPEQDVGTATTYAYNADDTVLSITDARGAAATYAYNGRHLTTGITYTASGIISIPAPVTYSYDAAANRLWMNEDAQRRVTYHYTTLSLMDWEERKFPGLSGDYRLSYDYNLAGQVKSITDPTNSAINYARDRAGRVTSVTGTPYGTGGINGTPYIEISQYASNLKYRAWGSLSSLTYGNQMTLSQEFDRRLRLSSFLVGGMTPPPYAPPGWETRLRSSNFQYYDDGNLRAARDNLGNVMDRAYSYDHMNRAKEAYSGSEALDFLNGTNSGPPTGTYRQSYQFDPFGNMTSRTNRFWSQTDTFTATYSNNRRQGIGIVYDAEGNLTHDADLQYTYDAAGHSASIFNAATNKTISPVYDGDGQVVNRTEIEGASTSLNFFQLRSTVMGGKVITELDSQGQKRQGYVYCDGPLIARQDHLWIVWQHDDPFTGSRAGSNRDGVGAVDVDPDPMGVDLGSADPYVEPQLWEPPPEGMVGLLPGSGIPSGRCMLDGMSIECRQAGHLLQIGAAEFEHPTTVWDNGAWHFVEYNRETGKDEIPFDGDPLEELAPYLGRPIDSSTDSLLRLFALNFSERVIPQNSYSEVYQKVVEVIKESKCAQFARDILGAVSGKNNPVYPEGGTLLDVFHEFLKQPLPQDLFTKNLSPSSLGYGNPVGNISKGTAQIALPGFPDADGIIAELFHLAGKNSFYTDKQLAGAVRKFPQYSKVADQALDPSLNIYDSRYQAPLDWTKANQGGYSAYFHYAQYNICFTAPANNGMKRLIR